MRFISEAYSLSKLYLIKSRRLSPGQEKKAKIRNVRRKVIEKWYKGVTKKQRAIMLREYKHRHVIVRGKKWDRIILCEI